jgi:uncharacterized protein (TIGR00251 family)
MARFQEEPSSPKGTKLMNREANCESIIQVKVVPRSSKNRILFEKEGVFRIKLTAPPIEGKANAALTQLLSKRLRVPKRSVEIVSGERARSKLIRIYGLCPQAVSNLLKEDP